MTTQERVLEGIPVSPGIAIGRAHIVHRPGTVSAEPRDLKSEEEIEREIARFDIAVQRSREQLAKIRQQVSDALDEKHADIYAAQTMFLEDDDLIQSTKTAIRKEKKSADFLFNRKISEVINVLTQVDDEFFRSRDSDILDIANRVTNNLSLDLEGEYAPPTPGSVLVAHDLAPSQTTPLIKDHVLGLVLEKGGPTSHTAIMAKALEIPAVVGVPLVANMIPQGAKVIVDGLTGRVVVNPSAGTLARYNRELKSFSQLEKELSALKDKPAETKDGYFLDLRANIEIPEEIDHIAQHGAQGIGLFRTEFTFMNRSEQLTEEEQFELYKMVAEKAKPNHVVFRTLDIGGDKFLSKVEVSPELNPYMGQRAVRLCLQHPEIFGPQLRAILRASAFGNVRILIPMISGVEELLAVKRHVQRAKQELRARKQAFDNDIQIGAMIEVPSAAIVADILARHCDFFSIGSNDLIQYSLAVDRGNESVAYLYEPLHPAILRLLRNIVVAGHKHGIPVCVCGEIAANPMMAVILMGMGVDELSMSSVSVPPVKKIVRSIRLQEAKSLAEEILLQTSIDSAKRLVQRRMKQYIKSGIIQPSAMLRLGGDAV